MLSKFLQWDTRHNLHIIGDIPQGLPQFGFFKLSWDLSNCTYCLYALLTCTDVFLKFLRRLKLPWLLPLLDLWKEFLWQKNLQVLGNTELMLARNCEL